MMAHVSGSDLSAGIMSGAMILWWQEQLREEHSGYLLSSMNTPESPWRFWLKGVSLLRMLSIGCSIYSYSGVLLNIFALTMTRNTRQRQCADGWIISKSQRALHWTRESLVQWVHRVIWWQAKRWAARSRNIHYTDWSENTHWSMAQGIQPHKAP